jgi:hypothetical protein
MMLFNEYRYWKDYECDEDGLYDGGLLVPADHAVVLRTLSEGALLTAVIGLLTGNRYLAWGTCFGSFVAQQYWSEPRYSWTRNLDIACVLSLIVAHWWAAWGSSAALVFYTMQVFGMAMYCVSWYFALKRQAVPATLAHVVVHVVANTSVILLYLTLGG